MLRIWLDIDRPQLMVVDILERHGQHAGRSVDRHVTKELQAATWREIVTLLAARRLLKHDTWTECRIQAAWGPGPGVDRSRNKFPEGLKILENCSVWIEIVRSRVVQVSGNPHRVANSTALHEGKQISDFNTAADRSPNARQVSRDRSHRSSRCNYLPGSCRAFEFALEPGDLRRTEQIGIRAVTTIRMSFVRAAVTAHVEQKQVEQRSIRYLSVDAPRL